MREFIQKLNRTYFCLVFILLIQYDQLKAICILKKGEYLMYRSMMALLLIYQQPLCAMMRRSQTKPIHYQSVVPCHASGIPSLRVLAAQKVHEINREKQLTLHQQKLFSPVPGSCEEIICNELLQQDFSHMRKDIAEHYARDLASDKIPRTGSSGRVKQKVLAIEIQTKIHR
jgi:hypothetical protein